MSKKFEDIKIWNKAKILVLEIYKELRSCKDYSFCDQIKRASVSIMNNVAEGYDRESDTELKRFLVISRGSCAEVRSMLYLSMELGYIEKYKSEELIESTREISRMLTGFIKKL